MYLDLIHNLALLVALSVVSGFILQRRLRDHRVGAMLQGGLFGAAAVLGMLRPLELGPGLIFDGRSVMISLCALYFGPWAAGVSVVLAIACRTWLGGGGLAMGILVILASAAIGVVAHARIGRSAEPPCARTLYTFGLVVHVAMVLAMFALPAEGRSAAFERIAPPVLLLYPLATLLAGKILSDQQKTYRLVDRLQRSNKDLEVTLHSIGDAVVSTDLNGRIARMNPVSERLTGWSESSALGRPLTEVFQIFDETTGHPVANPVEAVLRLGTVVELANHTVLVARDGSRRSIADSAAPIRDEHGTVSGVVLVFSDQTTQHKVREELRESEARYRALFEESNVTMLLIDPESGRIQDANAAACTFYGWSRERLQTMSVTDINTLPPEELRAEMKRARERKTHTFAFRHRLANKEVRDVEIHTGPVSIAGRALLLSVIQDVTESKRRYVLLSKLAAQVPGVVYQYILHADGRSSFPYASPGIREIYECDPGEVETDATPILTRLHPEDREPVMEAIAESARTLQPFHCEFRVVLPRQGLRWRLSNAMPERLDDGSTLWHGIISDITDRKLAAEAARASSAEKESLLREVHHRVKNNLQVITSLLRLQAARATTPDTREVLAEMQGRIRSMALLHETLHRSENLARVDLDVYLRSICSLLQRAVARHDTERVRISFDLQSVRVTAEQAAPCGLIANELLSNALKHAFPAGRAGIIQVSLSQSPHDLKIHLCVSDDGVGLPDNFAEIQEHSLGLQLVSDLSKQLDGSLEVRQAAGTMFFLSFPPRGTH